MAESKYLAKAVTKQNCIHEEVKNRLNSGNACYHSVHSLLTVIWIIVFHNLFKGFTSVFQL